MSGVGRRLAACAPPVLAAAGAGVALVLWVTGGSLAEVRDLPTALAAAGRGTGLLGAYLALLQLVLLARLPVLERLAGFDRLAVWHRRNGQAALGLIALHVVCIVAAYAITDGVGPITELGRLVRGYPGVITALAGFVLLVLVVVSSLGAVRRRLRYEAWWFGHLYAYLAIALAFSHQLATGTDFVGRPAARAYWVGLYVATAAVVVLYRFGAPLARSVRHRLRVVRVVEEAPGVVSVEVGGVALDRLRARSGQFFAWRFLTRDRWHEAHPFSLSAAPDGRRLRITVKGLGDFTERLRTIPPGTRVIAEGPFGTFTADRRRRPAVALIAGGVGITPIRALLEDMPGEGPIDVVYRATRDDDVILRAELDELAARRGARVHYVVGERERWPPEELVALVPDIADRDVYVCGPPAMTSATRDTLERSGVSGRHIVVERFAY